MPINELKKYEGIAWKRDSDDVGVRFEIWAAGVREAGRLARERFGEDAIITLSNKEEADRIR